MTNGEWYQLILIVLILLFMMPAIYWFLKHDDNEGVDNSKPPGSGKWLDDPGMWQRGPDPKLPKNKKEK